MLRNADNSTDYSNYKQKYELSETVSKTVELPADWSEQLKQARFTDWEFAASVVIRSLSAVGLYNTDFLLISRSFSGISNLFDIDNNEKITELKDIKRCVRERSHDIENKCLVIITSDRDDVLLNESICPDVIVVTLNSDKVSIQIYADDIGRKAANIFAETYNEFIGENNKYLYVSECDFNDVDWKNGDFDMLINKLLGE